MAESQKGIVDISDAYHRWDGTVPEGPHAQLLSKAWRDPDFKRRLLADPKKVISEDLGVQLPANWEMKVLEETEKTHYLVLPARPAPREAGRLADEELEAVAGGKTGGGGGLPAPTDPKQCIGTNGDVVMDT